MPFDSDKQRRFLWSQKPEVAKQIAYKQEGGRADSWWNRRIAGVPQHVGYSDDPDNIAETVLQQDPYGGKYLKDSIKRPGHYVDQADYYIPKFRPEVDEEAGRIAHNLALKAEADRIGFKFNHGGEVPMDHGEVKKVTQKDRYGNTISYEFESPVKPLDQTAIVKEVLSQGGTPDSIEIGVPEMDEGHPGEPRGTDTVPAWLTPGEFVVNAEATQMYGPQIEAMNDHGRALQAQKGMMVPGYQEGGSVPAPFIAAPMLTDPKYMDDGGWITDELLDKLAWVESGAKGNKAKSKAGAIGKYQWLPSSAKKAGYGVSAFDPLDEKAARAATAKYLRNMQKHHGFTPEETLRAYNWGPGNVINYKKGKRKDIPAEALNYPGKILGVENIEGVTPQGDDVLQALPTARPGSQPVPTPTPRPITQPEAAIADEGWKSWLNRYVLGDKTQLFNEGGPVYMQYGGNPHFDTLASEYEVPSNVVPALTDVPKGHQMFGGNQDLGGNIVQQGPTPKTEPWWSSLLGHKSKEALGFELDPNEARLYHEANPSLVGDDPVADVDVGDVEGGAAGVKEKITTVPGESLVGQQDDFSTKGNVLSDEEVDYTDPGFKEDIKKKTAEKIDEAANNNPNATGPGSEQKGNNATEEEVVNAAEKDPSLVEKAGGFLKEAFGDLFDGKELARAAILYAGSRALGYSHDGSLQYAAKGYLTRLDSIQAAKVEAAKTKDKRAFELAKTDKFTPASVSKYKQSGNPADLVSKKAIAGATPTGVTEQRLIGGKKVSVQQIKTPNGSTAYMMPNGKVVSKATLENSTKPYDASFDKGTSEYRTRRARATKANTDLFKEIQSREGKYKVGDETKYRTGIIPSQAAQDFWTFAEKYGVDPESDEAQDLMGAAYRQAIRQSSIEDAPVAKNLKPFLEAAYIRQQTGAPHLFQINPDKDVKEDAKFVRSDKMQKLISSLDSVAEFIPALQNTTSTDSRNQMVNALVSKWGSLPEDERKQWNRRANDDETGFFLFSQAEANDWITTKKLGE